MIDYYEELSLSKELDTKRIQEELIRLESLWHKREVNSPEKANKMLGIIMDAQKAFASEALRKKYDNDLESSKKEPEDPEVLRSKSLEKWTGQARMFYNDGQYDLAKASIDRALTYVDSESDNGYLFQLAANIYLKDGDMELSLECINKAIISSPDWADYYIVKAQIYERMARECDDDEIRNDINECRNNLKNAVSKARAGGDTVTEGDALGMLAFSLYFHFNPDVVSAEEYARRAEALGECTNSKRVLDDIAEKKNSHIYNKAKKEEGYGNLQSLRKALGLYESLGDWKDASERASACRTRIVQLEEEEVRCQRERQRLREEQARKAREEREEQERRALATLEEQWKKKEQIIKFVKVAAPIAAAVVVMILINSFILHHKCGEHLKWSYERKTHTLTITGTGEMDDFGTDRIVSRELAPWYNIRYEIETVVVEDGVTTIGMGAFYGCANLVSVLLPDSLLKIEDGAFAGAENLSTIDLPESITILDRWAFEHCCMLTEINIPSGITELSEQVFAGCGFTSFKVPEYIKAISSRCFENCHDLESVVISEGVESIGYETFGGCFNLKEIYVPHSVTFIDGDAFYGCGDVVIYYSGSKEEWDPIARNSIARDSTKNINVGGFEFNGNVECLDGTY